VGVRTVFALYVLVAVAGIVLYSIVGIAHR
jgi:hypothetical protein